MAFQLSPGVNVSEIDLTTIVPSVATSIGAFAGPFAWGPVGEVTTISDESRLADRFGKPDSTNYEYWFSAANFLAYSNNLKVVRAANTTSTLNSSANGSGVLIKNESDYAENWSTSNTTLGPMTAKWAGALGNSLRVSVCASSQAFSSNLTVTDSLKTNVVTSGATVINVQGNANAAANLQSGDLISVDGGTTYIRVASVNATAIVTATAPGAVEEGKAILRKWQYADNFGVAPATSDFVSSAGGSGDEMHIIVIDEDGKFSNGVANTVLEKFSFVSKAFDAKFGDGSTNYYVNVLNDRSRYVWWTSHVPGNSNWGSLSAGTTFDGANGLRNPFYASMTGGADGTIGNSQIVTAYDYFANPDSIDISLIVSGPGNATIATHLISNIAEVRKDCMVFLSPTKASVVDNAGSESASVTAYRDTLTSSSYAVIDSGYKYQYDKYNDVYRWVPLNGDIAGTCARTDLERDPWFSPGGFNRGQIKNVIKLSWNPTKAERDDLYVKGINPVSTFQGEGTVLFGDKTMLSRPSVFDRINVRRLFIVLEKAIARAARSSLFEFNDQFTRAQFVNLVEPYLRDVQGRRGITDFRVVCDESNNTGEVIDRNEFVGDIYIKPARSINFIQLNFVAVRTGVSFEEVVGRF
jgi:phage tail sheath protein FI